MTAADLAAEIDALKRRVQAMERATQLDRSSVMDDVGNSVSARVGIINGAAAASVAAQALASATNAQATADGKVTIFYSATAPTEAVENPDYGDQWSVTVDVTYNGATYLKGALLYYDGDTWLPSSDPKIAQAIAAAANAQTTADGKIVTFWQADAPATASTGDLWYRTDPVSLAVLDMWRWTSGGWVLLPLASLTSPDYVQGSAGQRVAPDATQFQNVNVTQMLGAADVLADRITLAGQSLSVDVLPTFSTGAESFDAMGAAGGVNTASIGGTETVLFEYAYGPVKAGNLYRTVVHGHLVGTVTGDAFDLRLRYTNSGAQPTTAATELAGSLTRKNIPQVPSDSFIIISNYSPSADYDSVRQALTLVRAAGTGTGYVYLSTTGRRMDWNVDDLGIYQQAAVSGTLSQQSYADTTPSSPPSVQSYTKSWPATWGGTYDGDNTRRIGSTGGYSVDLYEGVSGADGAGRYHGNERSLFGVDYAAIQSALAGTTPTAIWVTYKVKHGYGGRPMNVRVSSHTYTSMPSTWASVNVTQSRGYFTSQAEGSTYKQKLPLAVATELKAGATRGLGFGPDPSNTAGAEAGYLWGPDTSARPVVTIQYTK